VILESSTNSRLSVSNTQCSVPLLFHYEHCWLIVSVHCPSVPQSLPSVGSVSLYSEIYPLSISISQNTVGLCLVNMSTIVFYNLCTACQYLRLDNLLSLFNCIHCCLLQSVHCLSVPHTVPSVASVSLCPLFPSTVCPLPGITFLCTFCLFLFHYVRCCLL